MVFGGWAGGVTNIFVIYKGVGSKGIGGGGVVKCFAHLMKM